MTDDKMRNYLEEHNKWGGHATKVLKDNKLIILGALKELKVHEVVVAYAGSGDSGSVESVTAFDEEQKEIDLKQREVTVQRPGSRWTGSKFEDEISTVTVKLEEALDDFVNDWTEVHHPGWENNDGASGEMVLNVETEKCLLSHTTYYTESSTDEYEL